MDQITWSSSDDSIASVDSNGAVTVHTCGKVTITASDSAGHKVETTLEGKHNWDNGKVTKRQLHLPKERRYILARIVI